MEKKVENISAFSFDHLGIFSILRKYSMGGNPPKTLFISGVGGGGTFYHSASFLIITFEPLFAQIWGVFLIFSLEIENDSVG